MAQQSFFADLADILVGFSRFAGLADFLPALPAALAAGFLACFAGKPIF